MLNNALSSLSPNSSLYSVNQSVPLTFVNRPDTPSFISQIGTTTHSTKAFASARAYSAYSGYANPQTIVANLANPGFNLHALLDSVLHAGE